MEQYRAERAVLENKFNAMYAPLFEKRADIVAGRLDVKAAEGTAHTRFSYTHRQKRRILPVPHDGGRPVTLTPGFISPSSSGRPLPLSLPSPVQTAR